MFGLALVVSQSCAAGFLQIRFGAISKVDVDTRQAAALPGADCWRRTGRFPQPHKYKLSSAGLERPLGLWQIIPPVIHCLLAASFLFLFLGERMVLTLPTEGRPHSITASHQAASIHLFPCVASDKSQLFPSGFLFRSNSSAPSRGRHSGTTKHEDHWMPRRQVNIWFSLFRFERLPVCKTLPPPKKTKQKMKPSLERAQPQGWKFNVSGLSRNRCVSLVPDRWLGGEWSGY